MYPGTTEQMVIFFGWKDGKICKEYISSSKSAIVRMANRLSGANLEIGWLEHCPGWDGGGWLHGEEGGYPDFCISIVAAGSSRKD